MHRFLSDKPDRSPAMSRIIAARFETFPEAQQAAKAIAATYVAGGEVDIVYVNPPGQHAAYPVGGDQGADEGAKGAGAGAAGGAAGGAVLGGGAGAIVGATISGPLAAAGAAVGAYLGSLAGTLAVLSEHGDHATSSGAEHPATRAAGVLVSVCADHTAPERVIEALRALGGHDIELADGTWSNGHWSDFDPLTPPKLVDPVAEAATGA
jgi:hypothetical protein